MATASGTRSTLQNVTGDQKRWLVFGIALNKVLVPHIRSFVEQEVQKECGKLQTSHSIHTQSTSGRLKNWPKTLKYENINGNDACRLSGGKYDYSRFDCRVTSHVDFAKLYVENHMAKFNAFDEHCDASAVLILLGKVPVFSVAVQAAAGDVKQARNAWAHCLFSDWNPLNFHQCFAKMEQLVKALGLPTADERDLLTELKDWENKGVILCMNASIDPDLVKVVQQDVIALKNDVDKLTFEEEVNKENLKKALHDIETDLEELQKRVAVVEHEQMIIKEDQSSLCEKVNTTQGQIGALQREQEDVQRRVTYLEDKQNTSKPQINYEITNCEADITFFAERHDEDTRKWLLEDFDIWFTDPGVSRAYVLLGDPGVGKSVMAGVLAQRLKKTGHLGAAFFCRHNDQTRNDPRCLLGTVACQLCECNSEYNSIMGGEDGVRNLLGSSKQGVRELFRRLLEEPLSNCNPCQKRKLVIIDALDETQYESREDFLYLIKDLFLRLPIWLVFFITSRPENTVQIRLKNYNPCVRICAGNVEHRNFFQQHDQDIKLFLRNKVDFSGLPFSEEDVASKCKGSFLYAFYIAKDLNVTMQPGKSFQLADLFPGDFDYYLLNNFKRIFDVVGFGLFKRLFGCAIVAPAPLPVSFISYVLQKENSTIVKKHVVDALSLFMVLTKTFTFLHNLIPAWLTDEDKAEELFIDRNTAANYLKDTIIGILSGFIREESQEVTLVKPDFREYILRFGIRFLCGRLEKNSFETVFNCLTSFKYIQNRIQSGRIEIYCLVEDYKLAADCPVCDDEKKEILLGVCSGLESNVFVLLECPHLLHSCLQNVPEAVQKHIDIPGNVSTTCLQWNWWAWPAAQNPQSASVLITVPPLVSCYAVSPCGKLLAEGNRDSICLHDSFSMETVLGPVKLSSHITHLEFFPDGKFLFYGRLDKWFSVERGCVETFPQFAEKTESYEWGSFTRDKQCIVVKRSYPPELKKSYCKLCMLNFLCLWATAEIGRIQESETICGCFPDRLTVKSLHCGAEDQDSPVSAMRALLEALRRMQHDNWCGLLEKLQLCYTLMVLPDECGYCVSRKNHDTPPLATVHDFIINHYSMIFKYQVWDVKSGKPLLEQAFSSGLQLSPFTYFCHMGDALETCGVLFSGIDKVLSLCNIALLNTVYHLLIFFKAYRQWIWREFDFFEELLERERLEREWLESERLWRESLERLEHERLERERPKRERAERLAREWLKHEWLKPERLERLKRERLERFKRERLERLERERPEWLKHLEVVECSSNLEWLEHSEQRELQLQRLARVVQEQLKHKWYILQLKGLEQFVHLLWFRLESSVKFDFLEAFHLGTKIFTNAPLELQTLSDGKRKPGIINMLPCVSPDGKWVAMRLDGNETTVHLYQGENSNFDWRNAEYVIEECEYFAFTNDSVFFVYLTKKPSMHALSLRTGNILTSMSGVTPLFLIPEKQTGFCFRVDGEENAISIKDFPSGLLRFSLNPLVANPCGIFASTDTILILCSNSVLTVMKTADDGRALITFSKFRLDGHSSERVAKCLFSQDGKLIATQQGTKILLYDTMSDSTDHCNCLALVNETKDESRIVNFAFSADSSLLLFWIPHGNDCRYFHVWDVEKKVISSSFDSPSSPELPSGDCCCCFASDNKMVIICIDFHIEIWDHTTHPCRLLKIVETAVPYTKVDTFSYCTVSPESDLLACCIADKILLYPLNTATHQSTLHLPRAHLGKIEFCQFLKGNRYLTSYGVDGMVFLWDLSECKAVAYAKIAQGRESIVSMAVSPEEDKVVCVTSFSRLSMIKLNGLNCGMLSKLALPKAMSSSKMTATIHGQVEPAATFQCSANTETFMDVDADALIEEMDFMLYSDVSEDSDEDIDEPDQLKD